MSDEFIREVHARVIRIDDREQPCDNCEGGGCGSCVSDEPPPPDPDIMRIGGVW